MSEAECGHSFDNILDHYNLRGAVVRRIEEGLINRTFRIEAPGGRIYILQKVNPVFPLSVNRNIDLVARHLLHQGMLSPAIVKTRAGGTEVTLDGGVWRVLTYIDGFSQSALSSRGEAFDAGRLVAAFHQALIDPPAGLVFHDLQLLDMACHAQQLRSCEPALRRHRRYDDLAPLVDSLLEHVSRSDPLPELPHRIGHGDLKVSNVLFDKASRRALCLIDLDTIGPQLLPLELGDAMRSWCNRAGEEGSQADFDAEIFTAAIQGYASIGHEFIQDGEKDCIAAGIERVCLTLALRFCVDAIRENYFEWDRTRFRSHSEHSQVRAESQLSLYERVHAIRSDLEGIVKQAFSV